MTRKLTAVALVVGMTLAGGAVAPADAPPKLDSVARLRALGRAVPWVGSALGASGTVTAVDDRSITVRSWVELRFGNAKEEDDSGTDRFGRRVRNDPTKPIVLSDPGWEVDCHAVRFTPEGMAVTVLSGQEVLVRNADLPTRRFPAAPEFVRGDPHPMCRKHCHLLADVRVGDEVSLFLAGPFGKEECAGVTIWRRPGGRVPYSTRHPDYFRYRVDRDNAYQDHEEKGTPIPPQFRRDLQRIRDEVFFPIPQPADPAPPPKRP